MITALSTWTSQKYAFFHNYHRTISSPLYFSDFKFLYPKRKHQHIWIVEKGINHQYKKCMFQIIIIHKLFDSHKMTTHSTASFWEYTVQWISFVILLIFYYTLKSKSGYYIVGFLFLLFFWFSSTIHNFIIFHFAFLIFFGGFQL